MELIYRIFSATWEMFLEASPYILFGLLVAGLLHVLLPQSLVLRWMGRPGLSGVLRAALIGVPLPVCSCGAVPITVELRRKGASQPAAQSFLITTPESSIDSILLTWGLMGPVMAIARPVAALFTAVLGGVLSIASARSIGELTQGPGPSARLASSTEHPHHHDHSHHHHHHDHEHTVSYSGSKEARKVVRDAFSRDPEARADLGRRAWRDLLRPALRYGFTDLLDDLAFWLLGGLVVAGVLTAILPDNLGELGLGSGLLPMLLLLIVGIPMYMCASASTPIAAALLAKGVSPGAALVFLLAGPATNAATLLLLLATFGRRFMKIYLASVVIGSLASALLLDALLAGTDKALRFAPAEESPGVLSVLLSFLLLGLIVRSLRRGAWRSGVAELRAARERLVGQFPVLGKVTKRGFATAALLLLASVYVGSGLRVVPQEYRGYGFVFGELRYPGLDPGLHYLPPSPFGSWEIRRTEYPRKSDIGFATDLRMLARRRELSLLAPEDAWHSAVAAMNPRPEQAKFLTADEKLVEMSFSVHYSVSDAQRFFYGVDHRDDFVNLYAESVAREWLATMRLDGLLTERRAEVEAGLTERLQDRLEAARVGVEVHGVQIVELHPPDAAVRSFRDVSSAREDRETRIYQARERLAQTIPHARGTAASIVAQAEAEAERSRQVAIGRAQSFEALVPAQRRWPEALEYLLRIESAERTLAGREKYIVPSSVRQPGVTWWRDRNRTYPISPSEAP